MIKVEKVEHEKEQSIHLGGKQATVQEVDFKDKDIAVDENEITFLASIF